MQKILKWWGFVVALSGVGFSQYLIWTNPDMTATRLWLEYPWEHGLIILMALGGSLLFFSAEEKSQ